MKIFEKIEILFTKKIREQIAKTAFNIHKKLNRIDERSREQIAKTAFNIHKKLNRIDERSREQIAKTAFNIHKKLNRIDERSKEQIAKTAFNIHKKLNRIDERLKEQISKTAFNIHKKLNRIDERSKEQISKTAFNIHKKLNRIDERSKEQISKTASNIHKKLDEVTMLVEDIKIHKDLFLSSEFEKNKRKYKHDEKIQVYYLFQFPSFYQATESLVNAIEQDDNFKLKILLGEFDVIETEQTKGARNFLEENNIPYEDFDYENFLYNKPHILILQSPYDNWHRPKYLHADRLKYLGIRIVYIPYGIELSDELQSRKLHFNNKVVENAWQIFTFSDDLKNDYLKYGNNAPDQISVCGLPRFDSLYSIKEEDFSSEILKLANGRKIVVWKMHFPYKKSTNNTIATPDFEVYKEFSEYVIKTPELFFIVMLHPKFYEMSEKNNICFAPFTIDRLRCYEHVFIHESSTYQAELKFADYLIMDRSAVLIESIVLNKPILYMENDKYREKLTRAVQPIVESYYKGTTCQDMIDFLSMCKDNKDPKRKEREKVVKEFIFYDGKSGERVKETILSKIRKEEVL